MDRIQRCARLRPTIGECAREFGAGWSADRHTGVAPGGDAASWIAQPFRRDAQAGNEAERTVDQQQFAMIAAHPAERTVETRRVVGTHLPAGGEQRLPECCFRIAQTAEPVPDHAYTYARLRALDERGLKLAADGIVGDDVVFQKYTFSCAADRGQPRIEVGARVDQQIDGVAGIQRRTAARLSSCSARCRAGDADGEAAAFMHRF